MTISGTPPAGGEAPQKVKPPKGPDAVREADRKSEQKAKKAWEKNLDHVQRGFKKLIEQMQHNLAADGHKVSIRASLDQDPVIIVADKYTGEIIREIPPEEIRKIAASLEQLRGLLLNQTG